jgi:hypothetical protein
MQEIYGKVTKYGDSLRRVQVPDVCTRILSLTLKLDEKFTLIIHARAIQHMPTGRREENIGKRKGEKSDNNRVMK